MTAPAFELTPDERDLWGITYENGVLRVRTTKLRHFGAGFSIVLGVVVIAMGIAIGPPSATVIFSIAGVAWIWFGSAEWSAVVIASQTGLTVKRMRTRRFPWSVISEFKCFERSGFRAGQFSPPVEVVGLVMTSGKRVMLWTTRGVRAGDLGARNPTVASTEQSVLQRYRDWIAPV